MNYFFYGTLMDAAVLARVSGLAVTAVRLRPAVLDGYQRFRVTDRRYPAIVAMPGHRVEGRVVRNIPADAEQRIVDYEADEYVRKPVMVIGPGGLRIEALAFVAGPRMKLTEEIWDYDEWCRTDRRPFLRRLGGYLTTRGSARSATS